MSSQALRVIGIACNTPQRMDKKDAEKGLIFLGLVGMKDPAREEVKDAIRACKSAGIKVIMITGDNENTAKAIAKEIGIIDGSHSIENDYIKNNEKLQKIVEDHVITGAELQELTDEEFESVVEDILIYARNMPENKLRIVNTLKKKGHVVVMTGDGVNDAPAIRKSDIGIAMGIKGTDVTKETAEVVLEDDNFATIVEAIKGGRAIYENIQKFTYYLISTNFAEVMLITIGIFTLGFELLPLIALQILFLNLVTEEMPAVALGIDPPRKDIMKGRIKNQVHTLLSRQRLLEILPLIMTMALVSIGIFYTYLPLGIETARTMVLLTMITFEVFNSFNFKSIDASILKSNIFGNKWLLLAIAGTYMMTLLVLYVPLFQEVFQTVPLGAVDWTISIVAASSIIFLMEFQKYIISRFRKG
jgi:Ca2+-transporting ATPase